MTFGTNVTINPNLADSNFVVNGSGGSNPNLIFADAGLYRLGIATNAPVATLDVASGKTFRGLWYHYLTFNEEGKIINGGDFGDATGLVMSVMPD